MRLLASGAVLMLVASAWAVLDYQQVVVIFNSSPGTASLEERIAIGQRSALFSHHAHYAAATNGTDPRAAARSFRQAAHFLLDTRLMSSGASAYAALGDLERARYLADRLREFKLPASEAFFSDCTPAATKSAVPVPAGGDSAQPTRLSLSALCAGFKRGALQSPDLPPCFSSTRTESITMPRSAALHMS